MIRCVFVVYRNGSSDTANRNDDRCEMVFGTTIEYQYGLYALIICRSVQGNPSGFICKCSSAVGNTGNSASCRCKRVCIYCRRTIAYRVV